MPLKDDTAVIGWINVTRKEAGAFADKDVELLRTFADQAVIAIQNVRLFSEVQARTRDLTESLQQQTATADVLKVISRSAFDLQNILDTLIELAALLCTAERAALIHQKGQTYVRAALHGFPSEAVAKMKNAAVDRTLPPLCRARCDNARSFTLRMSMLTRTIQKRQLKFWEVFAPY